MRYTATHTIPAAPEAIHAVLLDLNSGSSWVPALTSVEPLDNDMPGDFYSIRIREHMPARFSFDAVSPTRIDYSLFAAEMSERGSFLFTETEGGTLVEHRFTHAGALLLLMRHVFAGTAEARLKRLERRVLALGLQHDGAGLRGAGARERSLR